jgi:hypothetical protein
MILKNTFILEILSFFVLHTHTHSNESICFPEKAVGVNLHNTPNNWQAEPGKICPFSYLLFVQQSQVSPFLIVFKIFKCIKREFKTFKKNPEFIQV